MAEDEREAIRQALLECGSFESLLQRLAQTESEESRKLREKIENGPYHPSDDTMYDYVLGRLSEKNENQVLDHILACRSCLEEVFRIRRIEDDLKEHVVEWADETSWLDRLKGFVSNLSFPVTIQTPALEAIRGPQEEGIPRTVKVGDPIRIFAQVPADGHVAVFHYSGKGGESRLVFPCCASDRTRVIGGQKACVVEGEVEGPAGVQAFKVIWTKKQLIDPLQINWSDAGTVTEAVKEFFNKLERLNIDKDWQGAVHEYQVMQS